METSINERMSLAATALRCASDRTSLATTANPLPCSPARAASTAAFSERILVYDPIQGLPGQHLRPPTAAHLLGTDSLGRDLFARIVYGAVHSLSGALAAVGIALVAGTTLGLLAGSFGGRIETVIMRLVDVMLSIPDLLLSLSIIVLLGFGTVNAAIAVGCTLIAKFARLVRSEVVTVRRSEYVEAAFGSGGTFLKVLWRHILPNSLASVIAFAALQAGWAILQLATLGFLGYGAPPPTPEWGLLFFPGPSSQPAAPTPAPCLTGGCRQKARRRRPRRGLL